MEFSKSITDIIQERYSCRSYEERPIADETRRRLAYIASSIGSGPLGTSPRFELVAATSEDRAALRGLGTYGFIKGAMGFIVGATHQPQRGTEDYGYLMELIILHATDLGLGTCWLGGSFTKSSFAAKISAGDDEVVPAVAAVGYTAERPRAVDSLVRRTVGSDRRLPWQDLFFKGSFSTPLSREEAGEYAVSLEMLRLGPSASNKQPWRVVKADDTWHFFLARTRGYGQGILMRNWTRGDMQRLDMGIAMCHFEHTAREFELEGRWVVDQPEISRPDELTEYTASWAG